MDGFVRSEFLFPPSLRDRVDPAAVLVPRGCVAGPSPFRVLPEGRAHVILHAYRSSRPLRLSFVGPRSVYADVECEDRAFTLVVPLTTGGARAFVDQPLEDLADRSVPVEEVWGARGRELRDRLGPLVERSQLPACQAEIAAALLDQRRDDGTSQVALAAAALIDRTHGRLSVRDLASRIGISERGLRATVRDATGLAPKRLLRIARATRALRVAEARATPSWATLAASGGFYDQAHLVSEFRTLFGEPPTAFLPRSNRE